jgi:hypothetical protein
MKVGSENKRQTQIAVVAGVLALGALYPLYQELFGGPPSTVVAPPPVIKDMTPGGSGGTVRASGTPASAKGVTAPPGFVVGGEKAAQKVGVGGAQLDPTLHMEAMRTTEGLVYSGSGRNIFAAGSVPDEPVKVVVPIAKARPAEVAAVVPTGPPPVPPPPPINLKFFGTATAANGTRRAFLLNGDDVFLASTGDVVQRRYRVVSISANSIQVEDIPNTNKQSLPLQPN